VTPLRILRILLALVLLLAGGAVVAFGVMTVMYSDPVVTSALVLAIGLLLLGSGAWLMRRRSA
jgi:heme A synthase